MRPAARIAWPVIVACLLCSIGHVSGETFVPPTLEQMVGAKVIAAGTFVRDTTGRYVFVSADVLKGELADAKAFIEARQDDFPQRRDGAAMARVAPREIRNNWGSAEADRPGLWFFDLSDTYCRCLAWQPVELAEGYRDLLANRPPGVVFRALQRLDVEMQWEAMEELVARRDGNAVAVLHGVALSGGPGIRDNALDVLLKTELLRPAEFWGVWPGGLSSSKLAWYLSATDHQRFLQELVQTVEKGRRTGRQPAYYLHKEPVGMQRDLALRWLRHSSPSTREYGAGLARELLERAARPYQDSADARAAYDRLRHHLSPTLQQQAAVESSGEVRKLIKQALEATYAPSADRHAPASAPYSDNEEFARLMSLARQSPHLSFMYAAATASAARELAAHYRERVLAQLANDLRAEGHSRYVARVLVGYLDLPECRALVAEGLQAGPPQSSHDLDIEPLLTALARQSDMASHDTLLRIARQHLPLKDENDIVAECLPLILSQCGDPRMVTFLGNECLPQATHCRPACLLALAGHGDRNVVNELVPLLQRDRFVLPAPPFPSIRSKAVASALAPTDTPEATSLLKLYLSSTWPPEPWPTRPRRIFFSFLPDRYRSDLQNWVGPRRRDTVIAEVARRDPQWLVALAMEKMRTGGLSERCYAESAFLQLTGQTFGYSAMAFAKERQEAMARIGIWWQRNQARSREEWLLDLFHEHGYQMDRLWNRESLPVLCRALDDRAVQKLAVEQISVITDKLFLPCGSASYPLRNGQTQARVRGWLRARGYLPPEGGNEPQ